MIAPVNTPVPAASAAIVPREVKLLAVTPDASVVPVKSPAAFSVTLVAGSVIVMPAPAAAGVVIVALPLVEPNSLIRPAVVVSTPRVSWGMAAVRVNAPVKVCAPSRCARVNTVASGRLK